MAEDSRAQELLPFFPISTANPDVELWFPTCAHLSVPTRESDLAVFRVVPKSKLHAEILSILGPASQLHLAPAGTVLANQPVAGSSLYGSVFGLLTPQAVAHAPGGSIMQGEATWGTSGTLVFTKRHEIVGVLHGHHNGTLFFLTSIPVEAPAWERMINMDMAAFNLLRSYRTLSAHSWPPAQAP